MSSVSSFFLIFARLPHLFYTNCNVKKSDTGVTGNDYYQKYSCQERKNLDTWIWKGEEAVSDVWSLIRQWNSTTQTLLYGPVFEQYSTFFTFSLL